MSVLPTPTPAEVQSTQELSNTLTQEMLPAMEKVAALHRPMADDILAAAYANHELKGSFTELGEAVKLPADRMIELSKFAAQQLPGFFSGAFDAIADSTQSFGQYIMDVLERLIKKAITLAATFAAISIFTKLKTLSSSPELRKHPNGKRTEHDCMVSRITTIPTGT